MIKFSRLTLSAMLAATGSMAFAQGSGDATPENRETFSLSPTAPIYAQESARRPLMSLLDRAGVANALDDARIDIYGHVEVGYTYAFNDPANDLILGRVFDVEHDDPTLHQLDLNIERLVDISRNEFDIGFRIEMLYGGDARFIHANGLFDHHADDGIGDPDDPTDDRFTLGPDLQFDLVQAYVDVAVPVGTGLRIRAGKFLFFKQIDPNASVFFSHSFTFGAALPFTLTGITGYYNLSEQWGAELGISRGWGQALEDNNSAIDVLGRLTYRPTDRTSFSLLGISGPELDDNNGDWRTVVNFVARHQINDELTVLLDSIYGYQPNAPGIGDASWYGAAGYIVYQLTEQVSVGGRLEWFHDEGGFTTGVDQNLYEATVGLTITPFADSELGSTLKIRPELRYDYSDENFFNGLTENDQVTAAIDVIVNF